MIHFWRQLKLPRYPLPVSTSSSVVLTVNIILGILHNLTVHHDESLVQVWIIDRELLPGIAAAAEFVKVEEEGGEEDTGHEERESENKNNCKK